MTVPSRRIRACLAATVLLAILLATAGIATGAITPRAVLRPSYDRDGLLVVLVLGSDLGVPHRPGNPLRGRADAIHLVAVHPRTKRATIVDFPRDGFVDGMKLTDRLRAHGPQGVEATLETYTGIPIDFWTLTTFQGLTNLVDGMGGLDVVVDQPMRDRFSGSAFAPGPQRFNGAQALAYVRDRHSVRGGDFARTRHQGDALRFAHIQIRTHLSDVVSLARLSALFTANTVTNIPRREIPLLAALAIQIDPANVRQIPLTGRTGTAGKASVVWLSPGDTFARIRAGHVGP